MNPSRPKVSLILKGKEFKQGSRNISSCILRPCLLIIPQFELNPRALFHLHVNMGRKQGMPASPSTPPKPAYGAAKIARHQVQNKWQTVRAAL